jgi:hypothetical protein
VGGGSQRRAQGRRRPRSEAGTQRPGRRTYRRGGRPRHQAAACRKRADQQSTRSLPWLRVVAKDQSVLLARTDSRRRCSTNPLTDSIHRNALAPVRHRKRFSVSALRRRRKKAPVSGGFPSGPRVTRTLDPLIKSLAEPIFLVVARLRRNALGPLSSNAMSVTGDHRIALVVALSCCWVLTQCLPGAVRGAGDWHAEHLEAGTPHQAGR